MNLSSRKILLRTGAESLRVHHQKEELVIDQFFFLLQCISMELSERYIQALEKEGYDTVYEWQDEPGKTYEEHSHDYETAIMVTDGSMTVLINGQEQLVQANERISIKANQPHKVIVGENGVIYIIGEKHNA